ncbi:MAG: hypothetical protein ACOC1O_04535 [bacterium]
MQSKWLLINTSTWEEGKQLVRGFFSAYSDLEPSNIDYLEYESGEAIVDGQQIAINRSSNEPMKTSEGYAVKVDSYQVRKMLIIDPETGEVVGNRVDEYLSANPDVPVRYIETAEMREILRQEGEV